MLSSNGHSSRRKLSKRLTQLGHLCLRIMILDSLSLSSLCNNNDNNLLDTIVLLKISFHLHFAILLCMHSANAVY